MRHPDPSPPRGSTSPPNQLPSLQERLLHHRQEESMQFPSPRRPSVIDSDIHTPLPATINDTETWTQREVDPLSLRAASSPSLSNSSTPDQSPRETEQEDKRKRPRFLGDIDRRIIIQRLDRGEKQADLAREFGVTRAAICHINKNRDEILTRFDILAKSPQGRQMIENYVRSPHVSSLVRELRTASVSVLLTRLRNETTSPTVYRSTANRLMSILIEDALVSFGTKTVGADALDRSSFDGKAYTRPTFAVAIGDDGRLMLDVFKTMEPSAFCEHVDLEYHGSDAHVQRIELPPGATDSNGLVLLPNLDDAVVVTCVLETMSLQGIESSRLCVVCLSASSDALETVARHFQDLRIVTAVVEDGADSSRLTHFRQRYTTPICRRD